MSDRLCRETTAGYRLESNNRIERYDNTGRLTGLTDSQGRNHTFTYDVQKRLATIVDHVDRQSVQIDLKSTSQQKNQMRSIQE